MTDWIEERAKQEIRLQETARPFWDSLCLVTEQAVKSHQRYYQASKIQATFTKSHDNSFRVHAVTQPQAMDDSVEVTFDPERCMIGAQRRRSANVTRCLLTIAKDGGVVASTTDSGADLELSEFSRLLIGHLLIPKQRVLADPKQLGI